MRRAAAPWPCASCWRAWVKASAIDISMAKPPRASDAATRLRRPRAEQRLQVMREDVGALRLADVQPQASLRVVDVSPRGVIHAVLTRRRPRHLLIDHLEFLRRPGRRVRVAIETKKARIERRNVFRQQI